MYEVFNPIDGRPIYTTRYRWIARLYVKLFSSRHNGGLDHEREGIGW